MSYQPSCSSERKVTDSLLFKGSQLRRYFSLDFTGHACFLLGLSY